MVCTSDSNCNKCNSGYYLLDNLCVQQCPSNYYIYTNNSIQYCVQCSTGCIKCSSATNCSACRSDYSLVNGTCTQIQTCPIGKYADSNGTCQSCATNCIQCTLYTNCTQCSSTTYLSNGQCLSACAAYQYLLSSIVNNNVVNTCVNCTLPCDRCTNATNCTHCVANYYVDVNSACVTDCGTNYYASTTGSTIGKCVPCADTHCLYCTVNGCQQCDNAYYLYGYIKSNSSNGTCVNNCPPTYYADITSNPPSCKLCTISHCLKCNITNCLQCQTNYSILNANNTSQCVSSCPIGMITILINNISTCQNCMTGCKSCKS